MQVFKNATSIGIGALRSLFACLMVIAAIGAFSFLRAGCQGPCNPDQQAACQQQCAQGGFSCVGCYICDNPDSTCGLCWYCG